MVYLFCVNDIQSRDPGSTPGASFSKTPAKSVRSSHCYFWWRQYFNGVENGIHPRLHNSFIAHARMNELKVGAHKIPHKQEFVNNSDFWSRSICAWGCRVQCLYLSRKTSLSCEGEAAFRSWRRVNRSRLCRGNWPQLQNYFSRFWQVRVFSSYSAFFGVECGCKAAKKSRVQSYVSECVQNVLWKSCLPCLFYIV